MPRVAKTSVLCVAVALNSALMAIPACAIGFTASFYDYRTWLLMLLANLHCFVEGCFTFSSSTSPLRKPHEEDRSARRLALASSIALAGIYWCAMFFPGGTSRPVAISGAIVFVAGIALRAAAIQKLREHFRSDVSVRPDQPLVCDGIYGYLRHPSETGLALISLGASVTLGSAMALALWLTVALPLATWRIWLEERSLRVGFGEQFNDYRRRTGALLPRPRSAFR